jgi:DNA-binding FadR family transcriptional regulator
MIEPEAAALAATRADAETLARLAELLERMETSARQHALEDAVMADIDFHAGILAATGNRMIASVRYAISASLQVGLSHTSCDLLIASLPAHHKVLLAIENRSPRAARRAMRALIDHAAHDLQGGDR